MNIENDAASTPAEEQPAVQKPLTPKVYPGWKTRSWKLNVVEDSDAPQYYSQRSIFIFSILFGVIFGAGMLAVNVRKEGHKNVGIGIVILGILYYVAQLIFLGNLENRTTSGTFIISALGALILDFLFWHKYLGYNTLYRAKPIWKPLIIALAIYIPIGVLVIWAYSLGI